VKDIFHLPGKKTRVQTFNPGLSIFTPFIEGKTWLPDLIIENTNVRVYRSEKISPNSLPDEELR
jgi:hypothetical protein